MSLLVLILFIALAVAGILAWIGIPRIIAAAVAIVAFILAILELVGVL